MVLIDGKLGDGVLAVEIIGCDFVCFGIEGLIGYRPGDPAIIPIPPIVPD
jgi:hypothetical protein